MKHYIIKTLRLDINEEEAYILNNYLEGYYDIKMTDQEKDLINKIRGYLKEFLYPKSNK